MTDPATRTTTRPRGSIQHAPTPLSPVNINGRAQGGKEDSPCCRHLPQGPSAHLLHNSLRL
ncbi:hypothetical protein Hanom_Chr05g00404751 [Helianthus anomalus]